jgi:adenylyltransferase/sulfurtransferase
MNTDTGHLERFSRQIVLPFIGTQGQEKLLNSHIVVVGCGGLGCPLLLYLASSGVGKITIIDNDTVSASNLHRQILFNHHDIGCFKAVVAAEKLMQMHPHTTITPITQRLDTKLANALCQNVDLVIDGTDSFLSKYILSAICPVFLTASVVGVQGYIAGFSSDVRYHDIFPTIPDNAPNCSQTGVLPSVAGLIGSFLATEAIKIILNHSQTIIDKMIHINLDTLRFSTIKLNKDLNTSDIIIPVFEYMALEHITTQTLIDVREPHELQDNPLPKSAVSMPLSSLNIDDLIGIKNPVFKCQTGRRAERVALKLGLLSKDKRTIGIIF